MSICSHRPRPRSLAYGDWYCQRRRWHPGRHRFNNYTWRRGAKAWCDIRYAWRKLRHWLLRESPWRRPYCGVNTRYEPVPILQAVTEKDSEAVPKEGE